MDDYGPLKFCIVCSNLHGGGGVQVATALLAGLLEDHTQAARVSVFASTVVDRNLREVVSDTSIFGSYQVIDHQGIATFWSGFSSHLKKFDVVFTVFGPLYIFRKPKIDVVGFAQPWIICRDNEIYQKLKWYQKIGVILKYKIQEYFFGRADFIVVELDHVKRGLINSGIGCDQNIRVIHNCLSSLYCKPWLWLPVRIPVSAGSLKIGFVGRNYPHKNTAIFPEVHKELKCRHGLNVRFFVTFTDSEWQACSSSFKEVSTNVGALSVAQCPWFYRAVDGVIFPSLLECFSATPLEAMAMERPLFASDRPFIRDVCGVYANYFDPLNAASIADSIAKYFKSHPNNAGMLIEARSHAMNFSNNEIRTKGYMEYLNYACQSKRID